MNCFLAVIFIVFFLGVRGEAQGLQGTAANCAFRHGPTPALSPVAEFVLSQSGARTGPGERAFVARNGLVVSARAYSWATYAAERAVEFCQAGNNTAENAEDAIRHFLAAYLTYRNLGAEIARDAMASHEIGQNLGGASTAMDIDNNEVGFSMAEEHRRRGIRLTLQPLMTLALELMVSGRLRVNVPSNTPCDTLRKNHASPSEIRRYVETRGREAEERARTHGPDPRSQAACRAIGRC